MYIAGEKPGKGTYICTMCQLELIIEDNDEELPPCPDCDTIFYDKVV